MEDKHELEKIDIIRERLGLGYVEAKRLLEKGHGNVVEALALYEDQARQSEWEQRGREVWEAIKDLINRGNVTKLRIKCNNKVFLELPVTAGVVGTLLAPRLALFGAFFGAAALLMGKCSVELETRDRGTIVRDLSNPQWNEGEN